MGGMNRFVARAFAQASDDKALERLTDGLGPGPFALVMLFMSPDADLPRIARTAEHILPAHRVVGCTTAGEISGIGYDEGSIVAIGFPSTHFAADTLLMEDLTRLDARNLAEAFLHMRQRLALQRHDLSEELAILLVDGLSVKEDELASALATGLGSIPLVGGSAGDGTRFRETFVLHGSRLLRNAAVLSAIRSTCPVRVFNIDNLTPTERCMVVTEAEPDKRIVRRLNAEPAGMEYARLLGKDPARLDTFTFAAHPLAVRVGARHHVRAIQRMLPTGELVFFSAIDEGVILTITEPRDLASHLASELTRLREPAEPAAVLAFDCILRRIESQEKQMTAQVSALLRQNGVIGFSTYGEQIGPMHVNQTMTGIAFYPPGTTTDGIGA